MRGSKLAPGFVKQVEVHFKGAYVAFDILSKM